VLLVVVVMVVVVCLLFVGLFCVWFLHVQVGVLARAAP
jgi:hypothetical protein